VHPGFKGRPLLRRRLGGLRVLYVWVRASPSRRRGARLASYGSYAAMAAAVGSALSRPDVVIASSPPLSVGAVGATVAKRFRVPWLLDVRDLWPEAAVALGELSEGKALEFAEWLERRLYRSAAAITTPTEPFRASIAEKAPSAQKVTVLPNGTTAMWLETGTRAVDREGLGLPSDRFVWTYAGNLGLSQSLDDVIEAARLLGEGYQLVLIGHGPARDRLEANAATLPPGAVIFKGTLPPRDCARWLRASDAVVVSLADDPALAKSVPIKLYDSCAVGRPVIVAAPGEARRLSAEAGAAVTVPPEDPAALADAVRRLHRDGDLRARMSHRAREFARAHTREAQVPVLEDVLLRLRS